MTNTGILPLTDLGISVGICSIKTEKGDFFVVNSGESAERCGLPRIRIGDPRWNGHILRSDESYTITLTEQMNVRTPRYTQQNPNIIGSLKTLSRLVAADVVIVVKYHPFLVPFEMTKPFRFVAEMQPNDRVMWKPRPMD